MDLRTAAQAFLGHVEEAATWPTPGIGCDGKCKEADALRAALDASQDQRDVAPRDDETPGLDVERLARALIEAGLMRRFIDYAHRAHPETMYDESPEQIARSWAPDIAAEYDRLVSQPHQSQEPVEP